MVSATFSDGPTRPRDLGYEAHRLARLLRRSLEDELAPLALTGPQAAVLLAVAEASGPLSPAALAERLGMDRPTLSGVLARLERDGRLLIDANPDDGRSRLLRLSRRAEGEMAAVRAAAGRVSERALRGLQGGEVRRLQELMDRVARSLEAEQAEEARS